MRLKLVSDIHGAYEELACQLEQDDTLIMLGDYINLIDFFTLDGLLSRLFSQEEIRQVLRWIERREKAKALEFIQRFTSPPGDRYQEAVALIRESYRQMASQIKCRTYLLYGNNDYPQLLREIIAGVPNLFLMDGETIELAGLKIGFISGSPPTPWTYTLPGVVKEEEFREKIARLGPVDILCSHVPPSLAELSYDVVAHRDEVGSQALLDYVYSYKPRWFFFGHVHNPRRRSLEINQTRLVNLGYFRRHKQVYVL